MIAAIRDRFGIAMLFDGHTIKTQVPRFFDGHIADLNLGSGSGTSADQTLARDALSLLAASGISAVLDDRFTGGYITRHYGDPGSGVHAVQLEPLVQAGADDGEEVVVVPPPFLPWLITSSAGYLFTKSLATSAVPSGEPSSITRTVQSSMYLKIRGIKTLMFSASL